MQVAQMFFVVHRESLTFDEDKHMFAGYLMWHTGDFGLNPEHPSGEAVGDDSLVGTGLVDSAAQGTGFQGRSLPGWRDWLARNDAEAST